MENSIRNRRRQLSISDEEVIGQEDRQQTELGVHGLADRAFSSPSFPLGQTPKIVLRKCINILASIVRDIPLPVGVTRLEWTAGTGYLHYDDYELPWSSAAVENLARRMREGSNIKSAIIRFTRPSFSSQLLRNSQRMLFSVRRAKNNQVSGAHRGPPLGRTPNRQSGVSELSTMDLVPSGAHNTGNPSIPSRYAIPKRDVGRAVSIQDELLEPEELHSYITPAAPLPDRYLYGIGANFAGSDLPLHLGLEVTKDHFTLDQGSLLGQYTFDTYDGGFGLSLRDHGQFQEESFRYAIPVTSWTNSSLHGIGDSFVETPDLSSVGYPEVVSLVENDAPAEERPVKQGDNSEPPIQARKGGPHNADAPPGAVGDIYNDDIQEAVGRRRSERPSDRPPDPPDLIPKFLNICLHTGPGMPCLKDKQLIPAEEDNVEISSDQELFRQMRNLREVEKKLWTGSRLQGIHFVKFQVRPKRVIDNIQEGKLPPMNDPDYHYNLGADEEVAPPGANYMKYLYDDPAAAADDTLCLDAFPKKLRSRLLWEKGAKNVGWGMYFKEEPEKILFIAVKGSASLSVGLIFGVLWNVFHHSDQKAFPWTVVTWIMVLIYALFDMCEEWLKRQFLTPTLQELKDK